MHYFIILVLLFACFSQFKSSAFEFDLGPQKSVMTLAKEFEARIQEEKRGKEAQTLRSKSVIENKNVEENQISDDETQNKRRELLISRTKYGISFFQALIEERESQAPEREANSPCEEIEEKVEEKPDLKRRKEEKKKKRRSFKDILFNENKVELYNYQKPEFYSSDYTFGIDPEKYRKCLEEDRKAGRNQGGIATQVNLFQQSSMGTRIPEEGPNFQKGILFNNMLDVKESAGRILFEYGFSMAEIVAMQNLDIYISEMSKMSEEEIKKYRKNI